MSKSLGYDDTPILPNTNWHVHDGNRPQPPVVHPADQPGGAPSDAQVLFDGSTLEGWVHMDGRPCEWKLENGCMQVVPKSGDIKTTQAFGDCQLHLEMATPHEVKGDGQGRGNSGVFLMTMYEIQVLDCYDNPTYPDGTIGGIYGQYPPLANPSRKPGEWQTYDIMWKAPRFKNDQLVEPAVVTVLINNIVVQHAQQVQGPTQHQKLAEYTPHAPELPLKLQDHGDLVRFRNIWVRKIDLSTRK